MPGRFLPLLFVLPLLAQEEGPHFNAPSLPPALTNVYGDWRVPVCDDTMDVPGWFPDGRLLFISAGRAHALHWEKDAWISDGFALAEQAIVTGNDGILALHHHRLSQFSTKKPAPLWTRTCDYRSLCPLPDGLTAAAFRESRTDEEPNAIYTSVVRLSDGKELASVRLPKPTAHLNWPRFSPCPEGFVYLNFTSAYRFHEKEGEIVEEPLPQGLEMDPEDPDALVHGFSADGRSLAALHDGQAFLWKRQGDKWVEVDRQQLPPPDFLNNTQSIVANRDGTLVFYFWEGSAWIWDGRVKGPFSAPLPQEHSAPTLQPDGSALVLGKNSFGFTLDKNGVGRLKNAQIGESNVSPCFLPGNFLTVFGTESSVLISPEGSRMGDMKKNRPNCSYSRPIYRQDHGLVVWDGQNLAHWRDLTGRWFEKAPEPLVDGVNPDSNPPIRALFAFSLDGGEAYLSLQNHILAGETGGVFREVAAFADEDENFQLLSFGYAANPPVLYASRSGCDSMACQFLRIDQNAKITETIRPYTTMKALPDGSSLIAQNGEHLFTANFPSGDITGRLMTQRDFAKPLVETTPRDPVVSADGTTAAAHSDGHLMLWDTGTKKLVADVDAPWISSGEAAFNADGARLAICSTNGAVYTFDVGKLKEAGEKELVQPSALTLRDPEPCVYDKKSQLQAFPIVNTLLNGKSVSVELFGSGKDAWLMGNQRSDGIHLHRETTQDIWIDDYENTSSEEKRVELIQQLTLARIEKITVGDANPIGPDWQKAQNSKIDITLTDGKTLAIPLCWRGDPPEIRWISAEGRLDVRHHFTLAPYETKSGLWGFENKTLHPHQARTSRMFHGVNWLTEPKEWDDLLDSDKSGLLHSGNIMGLFSYDTAWFLNRHSTVSWTGLIQHDLVWPGFQENAYEDFAGMPGIKAHSDSKTGDRVLRAQQSDSDGGCFLYRLTSKKPLPQEMAFETEFAAAPEIIVSNLGRTIPLNATNWSPQPGEHTLFLRMPQGTYDAVYGFGSFPAEMKPTLYFDRNRALLQLRFQPPPNCHDLALIQAIDDQDGPVNPSELCDWLQQRYPDGWQARLFPVEDRERIMNLDKP